MSLAKSLGLGVTALDVSTMEAGLVCPVFSVVGRWVVKDGKAMKTSKGCKWLQVFLGDVQFISSKKCMSIM